MLLLYTFNNNNNNNDNNNSNNDNNHNNDNKSNGNDNNNIVDDDNNYYRAKIESSILTLYEKVRVRVNFTTCSKFTMKTVESIINDPVSKNKTPGKRC